MGPDLVGYVPVTFIGQTDWTRPNALPSQHKQDGVTELGWAKLWFKGQVSQA